MNRAEQMALEKYPAHSIRIVPARGGGYYADKHLRDGFIEGYHQAEKDCLENKHEKSWRLDEKLWKGIKDIEEASYQYTYDASNDWAYDIPTWEDVQDAFKAGSEWQKEQMMAKAIFAVVSQVPCSNEIILYNPSSVDKYCLPQEMNKLGLNKGDKIKLVIIKED